MAHPKSRISKQRKRKRRTHKKLSEPKVSICKSTGEPHMRHRAYMHDGDMYYKGQILVKADDEIDFEEVG